MYLAPTPRLTPRTVCTLWTAATVPEAGTEVGGGSTGHALRQAGEGGSTARRQMFLAYVSLQRQGLVRTRPCICPSSPVVPPRPRRPAQQAALSARGAAELPVQVGHRNGQLELEGGAAVCLGALQYQPQGRMLLPGTICTVWDVAVLSSAPKSGSAQALTCWTKRAGTSVWPLEYAALDHSGVSRIRGKDILRRRGPGSVTGSAVTCEQRKWRAAGESQPWRDSTSPRYGPEKASYYSAVCLDVQRPGGVRW